MSNQSTKYPGYETAGRSAYFGGDDKTPPKIEITPAMAAEGLKAFRAVAARHGFAGILACGFIHNAVASAYLAMEMQRAGVPGREDW